MTARAQKMPAARQVLDKAMSEDELLIAVTDALTVYQWRWTHSRRSDKALTMGHAGVPDIIAAKRGRVIFWELKSAKGQLDAEQFAWALAVMGAETDASRVGYRVITPGELDAALAELARP